MRKHISLLLLSISVWLCELALKVYPVPYMPINTETALKLFGSDIKNAEKPKGLVN